MNDFQKDPANCDHDDLQYDGMDVGEPGMIYENRTCTDCGAKVDRVYKPSHELVFLPRDDDPIEREIEN